MDTTTDKTISRQRRWQLRKLAAGQCSECGAKATSAGLCLPHLQRYRETARARYRTRHNIPLDRPVARTKPRTEGWPATQEAAA